MNFARKLGSIKKKHQHLRHCGITLLAHDNLNVLIMIDYSIRVQKFLYNKFSKKKSQNQPYEAFREEKQTKLTHKINW